MDRIEQWLVDQAETFQNPLAQETLRIVATRWHELSDGDRATLTNGGTVSVDDLAEQIAVGVHTGLRKGSNAPTSADLWQAISKSNDSAWIDAATFCAEGLTSMGYVTRIEAS